MRSSSGTGAVESVAHGERAACVTRAVERLREDRERIRARRRDEHVERLGRRDAKLVDGHGMHVLAVGCDDRHRQPGNPHVERRHRRAVDEPQPHALAGAEQARPIRRPVARPFIRYVYAAPLTSARSLGCMRMRAHSRRSASVAAKPSRFASRVKSPSVRFW